MSDDELLRRLGALAAEQERDEGADAPRLDELARERIVAHVVSEMKPEPAAAPRRSRAAAGVALALALAAAVAFAVTRLGEPDPLPRYALRSSGASTARGPESGGDAPCRLVSARAPGASFELVAKADDAVAGGVAARAFLVRGGEAVTWTGALEVSPQGSVRILDSADRLAGASELRLVVGRPEAVTDERARARSLGAAASGPGWQVLRCAIEGD